MWSTLKNLGIKKITETENKDLSFELQNDSIQSFIIKIPISILAFIYIVLLVRLFGPEGNGLYSFITTNLILLTTVMGMNYKQSMAYFVASQRIKFIKLMSISVLFLAIVICLFLFIISLMYLLRGEWLTIFLPKNLHETPILLFAIIYFIAHMITFVVEGILIGLTRFDKLNRIDLYTHLIKVIFFCAIFGYQIFSGMEYSILFLFSCLIIVECIILLFYLIYFLASVPLQFNFSGPFKEDVKEIRRYGLQGYFTQNTSFVVKRIDIWFIEFYNGLGALGNYSLANQITNFLLEFIFPINKVMMPYLTKMEEEARQKLFYIGASFSFLFMLFFACCIIALSGFFIPFIFGIDFQSTIIPARILSIAVVILIVRNNLRVLNNVYDRQKYSIVGSTIELILIIVLDILWIPKYGIIGAAYATLFAYLSCTAYLIYSALPILEFPIYRLFFPKISDFKTVISRIIKIVKNLISKRN